MIFVLHIGHCSIQSLYFSVSYNWKVQDSGNMDVSCVNESSTVYKTEQPSEKLQPNILLTMLTFLSQLFGIVQSILNAKGQRRRD